MTAIALLCAFCISVLSVRIGCSILLLLPQLILSFPVAENPVLKPEDSLDLRRLSERYRSGELRPTEVINGVLERIAADVV